MLTRPDASATLRRLAKGFPIVAATGPRQSGKTTLIRATFPDYEYLTLEDIDVRQQALEDPRGFLAARSDNGFILDEVQNVPQLFSYLQGFADARRDMGKIILTGSQNFLLLEKITQSLAGRTGLFELLPLTTKHARPEAKFPDTIDEWLFHGLYPALYDRDLQPTDWYPRYIQTYIDRDVRSLRQIGDLASFQRFVRLCAARIGQLLNFTNLANEADVDVKTAQAWISILEASYLIFLLRPHHKNYNKRLVKQPKLYFTDTGLAASLLGLRTPQELSTHYLRGGLFENHILLERRKHYLNQGQIPPHTFWRNNTGLEIDLIEDHGGKLHPIEIKSSATIRSDMFTNLEKFCEISGTPPEQAKLIYGGEAATKRNGIPVEPFAAVAQPI